MKKKIKRVNDALYIRGCVSLVKARRPILIVEDDKVDAMLISRAFKDVDITGSIDTVCNGEEALKYVNSKENAIPGIIFLDLNMPKMNGIEFLKIVNNDSGLHEIPIIVMSTSDIEQEKEECFKLNAVGFLVKPIDYNEFVELIKTINFFWDLSTKE